MAVLSEGISPICMRGQGESSLDRVGMRDIVTGVWLKKLLGEGTALAWLVVKSTMMIKLEVK